MPGVRAGRTRSGHAVMRGVVDGDRGGPPGVIGERDVENIRFIARSGSTEASEPGEMAMVAGAMRASRGSMIEWFMREGESRREKGLTQLP